MVNTIPIILAAIATVLAGWTVRSFFRGLADRPVVAAEIFGVLAADGRIVEMLGRPLRRAGSATGSVHATSDGLRALLAIPVAGSERRGRLYVDALRLPEGWRFASISLHLDSEVIELAPRLRTLLPRAEPSTMVSFPQPATSRQPVRIERMAARSK